MIAGASSGGRGPLSSSTKADQLATSSRFEGAIDPVS